jgi:hypothetical protein
MKPSAVPKGIMATEAQRVPFVLDFRHSLAKLEYRQAIES